MSGIFPNEAASAENFKINAPVMHYVNSKETSKHVGRVIDRDLKANRVWVQFPIGDKVSIDPTELIIATPAMGACVVPPVEVAPIEGVISAKVVKLAESMVAARTNISEEQYHTNKMASNIAHRYATDKVDKLCGDIITCKEAGLGDLATYNEIYSKYANTCSDEFIKSAIEKVYEEIS